MQRSTQEVTKPGKQSRRHISHRKTHLAISAKHRQIHKSWYRHAYAGLRPDKNIQAHTGIHVIKPGKIYRHSQGHTVSHKVRKTVKQT